MTRVVIDTNVFLSACSNPKGPPAQVLMMALASGNVREAAPISWLSRDRFRSFLQ